MPAETLTAPARGAVAGGNQLRTMPILILNIHERCNCRCVMCDIWKRETGSELAIESLARHRDSMRALAVREVVLTGGEPLLHNHFAALCSFLKNECGVRITLLTTGLLLVKRAEVIAAFVDEVIVSLDGPPDVHDHVRRVRGASRLIKLGVVAVRALKPEMCFRARCTVQKENYAMLRSTMRTAQDLLLDSISYLPADVSSSAFNRELVWPGTRQGEVALTGSEVAALEKEIELLIEECAPEMRSGYVVESAEKLRRIARRFREQLGQLSPQAPRCNAPWVSAVIEVDGSVRPCFFHPPVGSLANETLEGVMNGKRAVQFRRDLDIASNPVCQRCVCSLYKPRS